MKMQRFDQEPHAHFLTFSCYKNLWLFKHPDLYEQFVDNLSRARDRLRFQLWAFVVMPNHVHLLVYQGTNVSVGKILYDIKRPFSFQATRFLHQNYPDVAVKTTDTQCGKDVFRFWQRGGGYDRNIFGDKTLRNAISYINTNPQRKGLVIDPADWRWSSARYWAEKTPVPIEIDRPWFWKES